MIGCDACDRWYHGPCVGVSKAESDAMSEFSCPSCAAAKGVPYKYAQGQPPPRPKRTPGWVKKEVARRESRSPERDVEAVD